MSTEMNKIVGMVLHTCVDLAAGSFIANLMNLFFSKHMPPADAEFFKLLASTMVQACATILVAEEVTRLLWNDRSTDPTGGVIFISTLFHQPSFWIKVKQFYDRIFHQLLLTGNDESNNNPNKPTTPD